MEELRKIFEKNKNPEKAKQTEAYMKGLFCYLGIMQKPRTELSKNFIAWSLKQTNIEDIVWTLWMEKEREFQYVAIEILNKYCKKASKDFITFYEKLIVTKSWWDSVDMIAIKHIGTHLQRFPELIQEYSVKWIESDNMWLQRTAILFQNRYKENTDTELLFSYIKRCSGDKEFFIRKAIGWALRDLSKSMPEKVQKFVEENELSGLSKREALKHIEKNKK
ncbi:MAG: DNA alkylation repair protein [Marinilabiliales bacterium]|nr:MAG: DNA alkylation repair protein [Marinilabiliales bacterium]